ncbi:MAG: hypothetical protein AVDCRST_MAG68-5050 [uncultured Gemmatimonadetes bacterium]|uniref:Phage tail fiber protein n=1 Tax=uncultured Gemmatimonadota bacterium TaxID=203437 RepID=A0A6J4MNR4_9BACT|nr:MAG: hypothetical protein AVDCRST_MAG68-5050 [uncultured Gemmatimonadota bacterium]
MSGSILSSPESRRLGQKLASMEAEIERLRASQQATQLGDSTLYGAIYIADPDGNVKGIIGEQADGSTGVVVTDGPKPPAPSGLSLTPDMAGVVLGWAGTFTAAKPLDFSHVNAYLSDAGAGFVHGPSNHVGTLSDAGSIPITPLPSGTQWWARLVAVNNSVPPGESPPSVTVGPVSPEQVVAQDVLDGIVTEVKLANDAVTAAKIAAGAVGTGEIAGQAVTLSQLANGSVDATKLVNGAVTEPAIAANAVTANQLAANSVIAGKLAADSVAANNIVAGSIQTEKIAAGAVLADKIAANAVTAEKINALAVNADKIAANAINAGHITAGAVTASKLAATLILGTTIIAGTTTTGARVQLNSSGIEAFRGNGTKVLDFDTGTGDITIAGRYRSQDSGTRVEINPGGSDPSTIRLYSNGVYGRISAEPGPSSSAAILIQGSATDTGRLGAYNNESFVSYVGSGISRTAVSCLQNTLNIWAVGDIGLYHTSGSNQTPIASSRLRFSVSTGEGGSTPIISADGQNSGLKFDNGTALIVTADGQAFAPIRASQFLVSSSEQVKEDIRDARAVLDPRQVIRQARARQYRLSAEKWYTPPATDEEPNPRPVQVAAPLHFGPLAEELPPQMTVSLPSLDGKSRILSINLADAVGMLWAAEGQREDQQQRSVTGRAVITSGTIASGGTRRVSVTWDDTPLEVPTDNIALALPAMPTALGRVSARVDPASVTTSGCDVLVTVSGLTSVLVTAALPVAVEVVGRYLWTPPYQPEGA